MEARIWNDSTWIKETETAVLKSTFDEILKTAGFNVLQYVCHYFQPQGFTALWLLGESHFAVHTFPEHGKTYIELSSCNAAYFERFVELTKNM